MLHGGGLASPALAADASARELASIATDAAKVVDMPSHVRGGARIS
jgi:hypothetical protein